MADVLTPAELPGGCEYPRNLGRVIDLDLTNFDIWWIIEGKLLHGLYTTVQKLYPARTLIPFAKRQDNDDIACFDLDIRPR